MDVLTSVLDSLQLKSCLSSRTEVPAPWKCYFRASPDAMFHVMNFGKGYVCVEGESAPIPVANGDVIVLPHGHAHEICDDPASPLMTTVYMDYVSHSRCEIFPFEGDGPRTVLLCGVFHLEESSPHPLLSLLPTVIHIKSEDGRFMDGLPEIIHLMSRESCSYRPGAETMLQRLTDMLFIQVIRAWVENQPENSGNWLEALHDPQIGSVLEWIHQHPEQLWTVKTLAQTAAMSRSAFSARFRQLVGEPPMAYVTRLRMHTAASLLKSGLGMDEIALQVGYDSEVAFRKAFKRELGITPGVYRQHGKG
jgi:AraC-like DNA-binding protein